MLETILITVYATLAFVLLVFMIFRAEELEPTSIDIGFLLLMVITAVFWIVTIPLVLYSNYRDGVYR